MTENNNKMLRMYLLEDALLWVRNKRKLAALRLQIILVQPALLVCNQPKAKQCLVKAAFCSLLFSVTSPSLLTHLPWL